MNNIQILRHLLRFYQNRKKYVNLIHVFTKLTRYLEIMSCSSWMHSKKMGISTLLSFGGQHHSPNSSIYLTFPT